MSARYFGGSVRHAFTLSLLSIPLAEASWLRIAGDTFDTPPSNRWTYVGATNGAAQPLFRYDAGAQRIAGEWSQTNLYAGGDPCTVLNSRLAMPLGRTLTDRQTFRFGATIRIDPGTVPNTLEFYQIATFGLYNLDPAVAGPDRAQSDNFSGNTTLVRDANDLVEFNYFINNDSFGFNPFVQGTLIARMPTNETDATAYYVTGTGGDPMFHNTDMGMNHYLPTASNLFVEVTYYGAATGAVARRVQAAVYTDAARTNLLSVNGVPLYYWTQAAAGTRTFDVTHLGLLNYAGINFTVSFGDSTPDGAGAGSYDDLYVDLDVPECGLADTRPAPGGIATTWASVTGATYTLLRADDPAAANWSTAAVLQAASDFLTATNAAAQPSGIWAVRRESAP